MWLTFHDYNILQPPKYVGLENYRDVLKSTEFWHAWRVTLIYSVGSVGYTIMLAFAVSLLLYHARSARGFWRVLYFFPSLLTGTAEALILTVVWSRTGLINSGLGVIGLEGPGWLEDPGWALPALILSRYFTIGGIMLLFLGSRAAVRQDLYDAAAVDGASAWGTFRNVTLPMMTPILLFNIIIGTVGALQSFGQIFILTGGGPFKATQVIGLLIYSAAFDRGFQMGLASVLSWSLFLVILLITVVLLITSRRWVHYEGEG